MCVLVLFTLSSFAQKAESKQTEITEVVYKGKTFRTGDRVRIISRSGTMKPKETGYKSEVVADKGRTGIVLSGMKREATSYFKPDPNEPVQIVLVKWDAQKWSTGGTQTAALKSFNSTIHVEYLEVVPKTPSKPKAKITKGKS